MTRYEVVVRSFMFMSRILKVTSLRYRLAIQQACLLSVMILHDESPFVQDITVIQQKIRQRQDTGRVINGEQTHLSTINMKFGDRYDWRGQVLVYSERHGWHLKQTEARRQQRKEVHVSKRKGQIDDRTGRPGKSK